MNTNVGVNDKLLTGQTHPIVGELTFGEGFFGNADVHHDFGPGRRNRLKIDPLHFVFEHSLIDIANLTLSTGNRDIPTIRNQLAAMAGADYTRNSQLAGDNSGVTGPAPTVSDNGGGDLHNWFPVGIGHIGNQNLALLEIVDVGHLLNDRGLALTNLGPHGLTDSQRLTLFL